MTIRTSRSSEAHNLRPSISLGARQSWQLHKWLKRALEGERQIVFVTGEPCIGKTTLVEEFLQQEQVARQASLWIGRGQCIEHYGTGEGYLPLLDALGRLCREPGAGRLVELLDKHAPAWLAQMPALLEPAEWKELQGKAAGATHARMLQELAGAIEVLTAETPLVLWLEDLHWSDYSTLEWLGFLARRRELARLLVLGTYRPVEVIVREHPPKNLKHELQIHNHCKKLPLSLLSEAAVMEYLTHRFASFNSRGPKNSAEDRSREPIRNLAHGIYHRTDGNPLYMVNMVQYLVDREILEIPTKAAIGRDSALAVSVPAIDTPPSIREMLERNLEALNRDEQEVLESASLVGGEFCAAAVAAALDRPLSEVEACCTRLSRRGQFIRLEIAKNGPMALSPRALISYMGSTAKF
jgi:predicted ATPase